MTGSPLLLFMIQIIIKRSTWSITDNPGLWAARKSWAEKQTRCLRMSLAALAPPGLFGARFKVRENVGGRACTPCPSFVPRRLPHRGRSCCHQAL